MLQIPMVQPVIQTEAGSSVLIMTLNVDVEKATEVEMPAAIVGDIEKDEFSGCTLQSCMNGLTARLHKMETRNTLCCARLSSMRSGFEKNRPLYEMLSVFSPNCFPCLSETYNTAYDLTRIVTSFCEKYNLGSKRCAEQLFCLTVNFIAQNWLAQKLTITIGCRQYRTRSQ